MLKLPRGKLSDVGLLLIRVMVGIVFVFHGSQKLFGAFGGVGLEGFARYLDTMNVPLPAYAAVFAAVSEFLGGLALILGLATWLAVLPLVATMCVAAMAAHRGAFDMQQNGMEYPLTLAMVTLGIGFTGPGKLAANELFLRELATAEACRVPTSLDAEG